MVWYIQTGSSVYLCVWLAGDRALLLLLKVLSFLEWCLQFGPGGMILGPMSEDQGYSGNQTCSNMGFPWEWTSICLHLCQIKPSGAASPSWSLCGPELQHLHPLGAFKECRLLGRPGHPFSQDLYQWVVLTPTFKNTARADLTLCFNKGWRSQELFAAWHTKIIRIGSAAEWVTYSPV